MGIAQFLPRMPGRMQCSLTHSLRNWALENFAYMIIPPEKHNLKSNMKGSFPIKSSCRMYDVIISVRMKALAQHSLASVTLDKFTYVSRLQKTNAINIIHCPAKPWWKPSPKEGFVCKFYSYQNIFHIFSQVEKVSTPKSLTLKNCAIPIGLIANINQS